MKPFSDKIRLVQLLPRLFGHSYNINDNYATLGDPVYNPLYNCLGLRCVLTWIMIIIATPIVQVWCALLPKSLHYH